MLPKKLIKAVRHLEIVAKRAVNNQLAGQYQSVFKGRGMDFADVREYQPGDDIRVIDWNVSARTDQLHVKQFVEERELTVFLMVDASGSQSFGTRGQRKRETAAELAALMAFSAIKNNDRVGLLTFTDEVETFIPPKKGRKHVLRVIAEILNTEPEGRLTDIQAALEYFSRVTSKKAVVFLISDFLDDGYEHALNIATRRHEIIPMVIQDPLEASLPNLGLVHFEDPETGEVLLVDTTSAAVRDAYEKAMGEKARLREKMFRKLRMDPVNIRMGSSYIEPLVNYFRLRAKRL